MNGMNCEECFGQCTCFRVAPCSFCESHTHCESCGELTCNDFTDEGICLSCEWEKREEE